MNEQITPRHSWLAISSAVVSILALCTLPLPLIPSSLIGFFGSILGAMALWRIQKKSGTNQDRLWAMAGIVIGILPIISLCVTVFFLLREIPRGMAFLSEAGSRLSIFLSTEVTRLAALLSNLFR